MHPKKNRPSRTSKPAHERRSPRERDQLDLIAQMRASNAKLCDAMLKAFACGDGRALVAFGTLLGYVAARGGRAP
jgi:hypothetical protein